MSADIDCLKNTCECANHDRLLYLGIGERLEKELATAKATIEDQKQTIKCADNMTRCAYKNGDDDLAKAKDKWEKKLQSAKAENARLVEVFKKCGLDDGHLIDCPHGDRLAGIPGEIIGGGCSENCQRVNEALSTSNAIDYWQGEIREAEAKGVERASDILRIGREEHYCCDETCSTYQIIANKIGTLALDLRKSNQSNQSEGEKERKP